MGRRPCCAKVGLNRGSWSAREDTILTNYVLAHGEGKWRDLPRRAGLQRCGKSCRLRWLNYLRPDIKRGNISEEEEELIVRLHKLLGNRWSLIAGRLPGRTDNEIKNYWNTNLSKRLMNGQINTSSSTPEKPRKTMSSSAKKKSSVSGEYRNQVLKDSSAVPAHPPTPLAMNSLVVRTKAVRCTGFYAVEGHHSPTNKNPPEAQTAATPTDAVSCSFEPTAADHGDQLGFLSGVVDFNMDEFMMSEINIALHDHVGGHNNDGHCSERDHANGSMLLLDEEDKLMEELKNCLYPEVENDDFDDLISFLN